MKLLAKFNLIMVVLFGLGGFLVTRLAYHYMIDNARREVLQEAELMMESARSVRDYTSNNLAPLLKQTTAHKTRFVAETVPAFGATTTFNKLRQSYPDYQYKEATLNPTNLQDRADEWESDIIRFLRNHKDQKQVSGERDTPTGRSLYLAKPIVAKQPCLECHSVPSVAPKSMIKTYGAVNGFGWKLDEIIAAQVVSVPMAVPVQRAEREYHRLVLFLIVVLVLTILALDASVYFLVIRPLSIVSAAADRVSKGDTEVPDLPVKGGDEVATVTASFNRMRVSLVKALKMIEQQE
jgi:HAMP domain-containing protein